MNMNAPVDHFQHLWALGYHNLCSIVPPGAELSTYSTLYKRLLVGDDARGKAPGYTNWQDKWRGMDFPRYQADEYDLVRWAKMKAGVGIICRDEVKAIDADTLNPDLAARIEKEIVARVGRTPIRIGRSPKKLFVVRVPGDYPYRKIEFGGAPRERVEILSSGQQFVAFGQHPWTKQPYSWPSALVPYDELPIVSPEVLDGLLEALKALLPNCSEVSVWSGDNDIDQEELLGEEDIIRAAVAATPNTDAMFPSRESYRDYGYAIKAAIAHEPTAFAIFDKWCQGWRGPDGEENDPEIVAADWRRMKPKFRRGKSYVYKMAREATDGVFQGLQQELGRKWHEPIVEPVLTLDGAYYSFPTAASIEPREFLYGGHYLREYVSVTIAPTKVGKSSLGIVEALAMASGKPLLGVPPEGVFRVRIWNGEDPQREMDRRILAAMLEYGLTREDVGDRLLVNSGRDQPIIMAAQTRTGTIIHAPVMNEIIASIRRQKIDCFIVDPIIKIHNVSENDNVAIDAVVREWNRVAGETHIALDLVHHSRKMNGGEASLDDARGASALVSAARAARVLARMTKREAERIANIKNFKRLFRFADAASNMVAPGDEDDIWMEIKSVDLRNARFDATGKQLVKSDRVGVVKVFNLGGIVSDPQDDREARCFAEIATGDWRRDIRTRDSWVGHLIGRIYDLDTDDEEGKSAIKATVSRWIREKKIREIKRPDQHRNKHMFLEVRDGQTVKPDLFG